MLGTCNSLEDPTMLDRTMIYLPRGLSIKIKAIEIGETFVIIIETFNRLKINLTLTHQPNILRNQPNSLSQGMSFSLLI
jgi:hypothetical protein